MSSKNANAVLTFNTNEKNAISRDLSKKHKGAKTKILSGRALRRLNARRVAKGKEVVGHE